MAHARQPDQDDEHELAVRFAERPPDYTPQQWEARVLNAQLTLVRVLLRVRERLIREGKLDE